ncbi:MAG: hydroxymethylglutaryl-CoA synthase family protein [Candidatus Lambdaproteobacteria bacterium]|nr:hydroxymethylglutaryl-CoA synthase family protein [Candidatus Lambdaproteobacteria bacterium]
MVGITSFGAYIPKLRLNRKSIAEANAWGNAGLKGMAKGQRAMCNWDEDSVTMAVAAAKDALRGVKSSAISRVFLATTTAPFLDRQNAGIVSAALHLGHEIASMDITSSQKAGTTGLIAALDIAKSGEDNILFVASEKRRTKAASSQEMQYGHGAAALLVGADKPVAKLLASHSRTVDFIDHYRAEGRDFDYQWEERWIRDEGYMKIVPPAIDAALKKAKLKADAITHFVMPTVFPAVTRSIGKAAGLADKALRDTLGDNCGDTGVAHPLLMLVDALQDAKAGDKIMVAGFGNGCDVLIFEATKELEKLKGPRGVKGGLANGREEKNYNKFLTFNDLITKEFGIRAEADMPTPMSALYRKNDMVLGLIGGICTACKTPQYPKSDVCVNPECNKTHTQEDYTFADKAAHVMSWTADYLTFTLDPPGHYGMVEFDAGGRFMADFTDVAVGDLDVGMPVEMVFRVKSVDERRGFIRYFWKAVPRTA